MEKGLSTKVRFDPATKILTIARLDLTPLTCKIDLDGAGNGNGQPVSIQEGDNITVTGAGTIQHPYIISAILPASTEATKPSPEKITFTNASSLNLPYTFTRRNKYGDYPFFDVWFQEDGKVKKLQVYDLEVDAEAPNQTAYTFNWAGPISGFVILSSPLATVVSKPAPEKITFNNVSSLNLTYTANRRSKYGDYPYINIWNYEDGKLKKTQVFDLASDQEPPNQTSYTLSWAGPLSGFVIISAET